jgi:hypothetical protein
MAGPLPRHEWSIGMSKTQQQQGATARTAISAGNIIGRALPLKAALLALLVAAPGIKADAPAVRLTQEPVVFQLSPDQFRIAFGIDGAACVEGCAGSIRYRVDWQAEDGRSGSGTHSVRYTIPRGALRTIAVDYPQLGSAEAVRGARVVGVSVEGIQ